MRRSHPVHHSWSLRNQRFFCTRLHSGLLVERLGIHTRLTPRHPRRPDAGTLQLGLARFDGRQKQVRIEGR
jgi:hypothetical protein